MSTFRLSSSQVKITESGPKSDDEKTKTSTGKPSNIERDFEDECTKNRGDVTIGIIGGGMTPIYTSLLLKQCKLIKKINIADPNDELAGLVHDCSHIDTWTKIKYYGKSSLTEALHDVRRTNFFPSDYKLFS